MKDIMYDWPKTMMGSKKSRSFLHVIISKLSCWVGGILIAVWLMSCGSNQDQKATGSLDDKLPKIVFKDDVKNVDFGTLKEGDQVERSFQFTNEGDFPLIINNVTASCGCTIPEWPRDPIGPNEGGTIKVRFNSRGKQGPQMKTVMIYANTNPAMNEIQFKADVVAKPDSSTAQNKG